ncbi:MAG: 4Fe-4S binding protein [Anaerolineae bacterium]
MYGQGILKGLGVTFKHFFATYVDDIRHIGGGKVSKDERFAQRQGMDATGLFTVQYPEEKIATPERFRFVPFLVVNDEDHPEKPGEDWCVACGICAKVCPPQCIWIVRSEDPVTKRPVPQPQAFFIDIDICMNCGYCAEFCPFDAIKMDHNYELASTDRTQNHIYDKHKLSKPFAYWRQIAPTTAWEEAVARGGWEHPDVIKDKKKSGAPIAQPGSSWTDPYVPPIVEKKEEPAPAPETASPSAEAVVVPAAEAVSEADAEKAARLAKREAALAKKRARQQGGEES